MALSRTRRKELTSLKKAASGLLHDQIDLLDHASLVVREAGRQASILGRDEVAPRVRSMVDNTVRPAINSSISAGLSAADEARSRIHRDVLPAVSSTLSSALAALEVSRDPRLLEALARVRDAGNQVGSKVSIVPTKKSSGAGRYVVVTLAVVAAIGVAYAAWQTLRADDELWVSDDDEVDQPNNTHAA